MVPRGRAMRLEFGKGPILNAMELEQRPVLGWGLYSADTGWLFPCYGKFNHSNTIDMIYKPGD